MLWVLLATGLLAALILWLCNLWIIKSTADRLYTSPEQLPAYNVALLLGTSPYARDGSRSVHFKERIKTAAEVYHSGQVKHLLLSGANPDSTYNEPRKMYQALIKAGVPHEAMTLDFAGFRTLDSVVRAKQVFDQQKILIISQEFHLHRALFLADHYGLNAAGLVAKPPDRGMVVRAERREYLARVRALLDVYLLNTQPRFLGSSEPIEIEADEDEDDD